MSKPDGRAFLAAFSTSDMTALHVLAKRYGFGLPDFIESLLRRELVLARQGARNEPVRPPLISVRLVEKYSPAIYSSLLSRPCPRWVTVDYETGVVSRSLTHPGNRAGRVVLDARRRDDWMDTRGVITPEAVTARLGGMPRPVPKAMPRPVSKARKSRRTG